MRQQLCENKILRKKEDPNLEHNLFMLDMFLFYYSLTAGIAHLKFVENYTP